jgi:hypothetical protein
MTWMGRAAVAGAVLSGALLAFLIGHPYALGGPEHRVWSIGGAWLTFAVGAYLVRRSPARVAVALILAGGLALPLAAAFEPPRSSDDLYRYLWDGRVQAAGIDPYRYVPAAPELAGLRDDVLWPQQSAWCVAPGTVDPVTDAPLTAGCTLINRPTVPTIYPPVAEAFFLAVHDVSPSRTSHVPMQVVATVIALATTVLLLIGLRLVDRDPRTAVLWAWCPTVAYEAGSNAHVDVLAAFLTGLALICLARARARPTSVAGGALLGLAIATKLTPALVLPAVIRRRPLLVVAAAVGVVGAVYLPHVLSVGADVIGYLPGYLTEEGYADGDRFALLTWYLPQAWAPVAAVGILGIVGLAVVRRAEDDRPWLGAATMTGSALLVATPSYPWYAVLLVLMVALGARPAWLTVAAAGYLAQYAHDFGIAYVTAQRLGYGAALLVVLATATVSLTGRLAASRVASRVASVTVSSSVDPTRT